MSFRVRSLMEIVDGMMATVVANSELTDVNRGALQRILLEAAALQDADQYLQIARLKNTFSIETADGTDLDERGADFGITRESPSQSTGLVKFGDSLYTTKVEDTLSGLHGIGVSSLTIVGSTASFPATGSVILERDTVGQRELCPYSSVAGSVITLVGPTTISHAGGTSVIVSHQGADQVFTSGSVVSVPATDSVGQVDFTIQAAATLKDGDIYSAEVEAISTLTGSALNVGTGQVTDIANPPFQTATVTNDANFQGGRDEETDSEYRQRIKQTIQALSNGTINDLTVAASGVVMPSGQRVITAQVLEEFADPDVTLFIDDGTGSVTTTDSQTTTEILLHKAEAGQRRARVANWPVVTSSSLRLKKSAYRGGTGSATTINTVTPGVGDANCTVTGAGFTPAALVGLSVIDDNRNVYVISANGANDFTVTVDVGDPDPVPGSYAILSATYLTEVTDYLFNETTGDIELVTGLTTNDSLVAEPDSGSAYSYYTGLIQEVQKVLNGDPADLDTYPGVKAAGVKVKVRAPTVALYEFSITVISTFGTVESDLVSSVKDVVQKYVNGLGIGADVILAEIIAAVMGIPGITDVRMNSPVANIVVLDGVLPRTKASLITVL